MKIDSDDASGRPERSDPVGLSGNEHAGTGGWRADQPTTGHATHDRLLIARFAAGDVPESEAAAARELLASCSECRQLASDLVAIARATGDLPTPIRRRDFRLSPADAARLRSGGLSGWLARLAGGSGRAGGPLVSLQRLSAAVVAIGLVMAVVTSPVGVPGASSGTSGGRPAGEAPVAAPAATSGPASTAAPHLLGVQNAAPAQAAASAPAASAPVAPLALGAAPVPSSAAASVPPTPSPSVGSPGTVAPALAARPVAPPAGSGPAGPGVAIAAWQGWLVLALVGMLAWGAIALRRRAA